MTDQPLCILCKGPAKTSVAEHFGRKWECGRCGEYELGETLTRLLEGGLPGIHELYLLSGYTREQSERLQREPGSSRAQFFELEDFARVAASAPRTIPERAAKLLEAVNRRTSFFGKTISLNADTDYPLAYGRNKEELLSYARFIGDQGWAVVGADSYSVHLTLKAAGFAELDGRARSRSESDQVFVARYFHSDWDTAYEHGIKPAIEDSGFVAVPVTASEYNGDIVDQIIVEIRKSRFVVADTSGHRGGVYFEAGFALGLGLEVIFSCQKEQFNKSHFDVNHMNHVVWETPEDLRAQLTRRVQATIGFGPKKPKSPTRG